jgi:hypothetical protein
MSALQNVVYVAGVARSGTSWIAQVLNSHPDVCFRFQPFFAYEFKGRVNEDSTPEDYDQLFLDMYNTESSFLTQADKRSTGDYPQFEKRSNPHTLVFKENRYQSMLEPMLRRMPYLKGVGIVRHPCAVLNSWCKNPKEFPSGSEILREWRFGNCKNKGNEDYFGYYKWKEVAHMYLDLRDKYPDRFTLLRYEDAVYAPERTISELFNFLGMSYDEATQRFVRESTTVHEDSYYAVYKSKSVADKWRSELPPYIVDEVYADLAGTRLEQFLR